MNQSGEAKPYGMLAEFEVPAQLLRAAKTVRDAGYRRWDVYTPCPIHGLDAAMGIPNSKVGWFTFAGGGLGFTIGMLMIWFMNDFNYGLIVGGKPLFSPVYAFPVGYELTILLAALGSVIGMFVLNRLPRLHHPLLKHPRFAQVTHDKFYVVIECDDPEYSKRKTSQLLRSCGGKHLELVEE